MSLLISRCHKRIEAFNFVLFDSGMTPSYVPPECLIQHKYYVHSDVYQLGLAVLFILFDYIPYQDERRQWTVDDHDRIKDLVG